MWVSGLNGGLSSAMTYSVAGGGTGRRVSEAAGGVGGSAWYMEYLPLMLSRTRICCSGACAGDEGGLNGQVGFLSYPEPA